MSLSQLQSGNDPVLVFAKRYQAFFNGIHDGITIVGANDDILDANPQFLALCDHPYNALLGKSFTGLFDQEQTAEIRLRMKNTLEGNKKKYPLECTLYSQSKKEITVELSFSLLEGQYGRDYSILVVIRDVSKRKEVEINLHQTADEFQKVFDTAPNVFIVVDERRRIRRINKTGIVEFGKSEKELIGRRIGEILNCTKHFESARGCGFGSWCKECMIREGLLRCLKVGETVVNGEEAIIDRENPGSPTYYRISVVPLETHGNRWGLVSLENITEIKNSEFETQQLHNSITRANMELKRTLEKFGQSQTQLLESQKLEQVGLLASGFAHNLRTPLAGIKGYTQLLIMDHPKIKELGLILNEIQVMEEIINNLMLKSRKDHENKEELISINDIINIELKFLNSNMFFRHNVDKHIFLDKDLPPIHGVYSHFSQILSNLIQNALDAMYESATKTLSIETSYDDRYIYIEIKDSGCGIPEEIRGKIFDAFFTTKISALERRNNEPIGTGLGLNSVNHFIAQYGGSLDMESTPGQGTMMRVKVPYVSDTEKQTPRVLVVDDEESIVKILVHVCQDLDMEAYGATDGHRALELYSKHAPHIVVTDLCMPGLTGSEMMSEIRKINPSQKVIYISGYADNPDFRLWLQKELENGGYCAVLKKPFQLDNFRKIVDGMLPQRTEESTNSEAITASGVY